MAAEHKNKFETLFYNTGFTKYLHIRHEMPRGGKHFFLSKIQGVKFQKSIFLKIKSENVKIQEITSLHHRIYKKIHTQTKFHDFTTI